MLPSVQGEFRIVSDEPTLRFTPAGMAVCKMRAVASSRKKQDDGSWVDDRNCWVDLTGFKRIAENMAESFKKGDLVVVLGKIQTEEWTDKDNNKRTSVGITVDSIGPAITWDPAQVVKVDRQAKRDTPAPADDPWTTQPVAAGNVSEAPPF